MCKLKIYFPLLFFVFYFTSTLAIDKPNVLLIIADDMGVDAINGYNIGTDFPNTPNLDKLRESGLNFTNAWATPVCAATRASLITGKYGINNGVNTVPGVLKPTHKTVFTEIKELDPSYSTCLVGKWHLGRPVDVAHPITHGVGEYMGVLGNGVDDYNKWLKVENGMEDTCYKYVTTELTDYAIDWIAQQEQPWFMWLAHIAPHSPYHTVPDSLCTSTSNGSPKGDFKTMIESLDYEVGRLLASIPEEELNNTTVIFMGDNGTPGNVLQGFSNRRGKQSVYQGGINVPLFVAGKGVTRINETEEAMINVSDFYATIAQLVHSTACPSGIVNDGISFKHLLSGEAGAVRTSNYMELGANISIANDMYTMRNAQYKVLDLGNGLLEMYDLFADPLEESELISAGLTDTQLAAKSSLITEMDAIRGYSNEGIVTDTIPSEQGAATKYAVVHTGVSEFYNASSVIATPDINDDLYGQDAGRVVNAPSYTDNKNETITDEVTGLMWQQDMGTKMTYVEAAEAAENSTLGGFDDWRIPTIKELYSLILFTGRVFGESAETMFIDTNYFDQPLGDTGSGEREIDAQTWSSTHYTSLTMAADTTIFGVNFVDGRIKGYPKYLKRTGAANAMHFRLVRGNQDYGKNLYHDNGDGTVTDSATMLMWQKTDDGVARDWLSSISYCESLSLGGYDDWHLPTAKELQSLVDYSRSPDATNSAAIDPIFSTTSISDAEGNPGHYPYFWSTSPHKDGPNPYSSAVYVAFGEAKGQMNGILMDVHGAGAQRSDPKAGAEANYPKYFGPQGDVQRVYNHCRAVRVVGGTTAIKEVKNVSAELSIYPNPTSSEVTIAVPEGLEATSVAVYDISGKMLLETDLLNKITSLNISSLDHGIYLLLIQLEGEASLIKRVMKR